MGSAGRWVGMKKRPWGRHGAKWLGYSTSFYVHNIPVRGMFSFERGGNVTLKIELERGRNGTFLLQRTENPTKLS